MEKSKVYYTDFRSKIRGRASNQIKKTDPEKQGLVRLIWKINLWQ